MRKLVTVAALCLSLSAIAEAATDLVLWLQLDETSGTTAADSSTSGNDGTLTNMAPATDWVAGQTGGALDFDGVDDFVESTGPVGISGAQSRTMAFWALARDTSNGGLVGWGTQSLDRKFVACIKNDDWGFYGHNVSADWYTGVPVVIGMWQHHALTYDGTTLRWFINGAEIGSHVYAYNTADTVVWMGKSEGVFSGYFNGILDEVRIYSSALSAAEVLTLYNSGVNAPPAVGISSPGDGASFTLGDDVTITATASDSDGTIAQVEFFQNGTSIGLGTDMGGGTWSITWTGVPEGGYALTAVATDDGGATTESAGVNIVAGTAVSIQATQDAAEPSTNGLFTVTRSGDTTGAITVDFVLDGASTATEGVGNDFTLSPTGSISFASGETTKTITVIVLDDSGFEVNETVILVLQAGVGYGLGSPSTASVDISDDDTPRASFPFVEDFETGALASYWSVSSTGTGRALVSTTNGPNGGTYHFLMDSSFSGTYSLNELVLTIDLSGQSGVLLSFYHKEFGDEVNPMPASFTGSSDSDGVAVSADGVTWYRAVALGSASSSYQRFEVDLDALSSASGITYNSYFKIKFQQYDNYPIPTDGFAFDDIVVDRTWPPTITTHPSSATVSEPDTGTFTVAATGTLPFSYQWRRDGVNISGAVSPSYTTPPTVLADDGALFTCVVTNTVGSVTSSAATLWVNMAPPSITTHPSDQTVLEGGTATFAVVATGSAPLLYQWQRDGADIAGATAPSYTTPTTVLADDGAVFTCVVTNARGSTTSDAATLTVNMVLPPTITTHPSSQVVSEPQTATFSVVASGGGTLTYQWRKDGADVPGATASSYTTPPTVLADDGALFTCVVTNSGGSVTSSAATLWVDMAAPSVTTHPSDQTATEGDTAVFSVVATGSAPLGYQWLRDGVDVPGATASSYTTPPLVLADDGALFSCAVTNARGNVTSNTATLTVIPAFIRVTAPNGGETWYYLGADEAITWTSGGVAGNVDVDYSTDGGSSWTPVATDIPNTGSFLWSIPNEDSALCLVRVQETGGAGLTDESDAVFTIAPALITVTSPNGGETWYYEGAGRTITWTSAGIGGNRDVHYSVDDGTSWTAVALDIADTGSYAWTVPNEDSALCLVRIQQSGGGGLDDVSDAAFTITPATLTVISPNGGETWDPGTSETVTWSAAGLTSVKIDLSRDGGTTWESVVASTSAAAASYSWTVTGPSSTDCRVRVSDTANGVPADESDVAFTIAGVTLTAPNGGETWAPGTVQTVAWSSVGLTNVRIELSSDGGTTWQEIVASTAAAAGTYAWTVAAPASTNCLVRVSDAADGTPADVSATVFSITGVRVTSPDGGETWYYEGAAQTIAWTSVGIAGNIDIDYSADGGSTWTPLAADVVDTGSYTWVVPNENSTNCLVRLQATGGAGASDVSDAPFTIAPATISVTSPNGGESWDTGTSQALTWTSAGPANVAIELSRDGGATWGTLVASTPATAGSYTWTVTGPGSVDCRVRVSDAADGTPADESDGSCAVVAVLDRFGFGVVSSPQGAGTPFSVTITAETFDGFTATGFTGTVDVSAAPSVSEAVIGTGTSSWSFPMHTFWHDSRTQVIYLASEIGGPLLIESLALDVVTVPGQTMNNWTIRMKHTTLSDYTGGAAWEDSGWTVVYQTNETVSTTGWVTFNFTTPFNYNGADGLMVDFSHNNSFYTSSGMCRYTAAAVVRSIYYYTDSGAGDPLTWSGTSPFPSTSTYVPNVKLIGSASGLAVSPALSGDFVAGVWTGDVAVSWPGLGIALMADDGSAHTGQSNAFDVNGLRLIAPDGGEEWYYQGSDQTVSWTSLGVAGTVDIHYSVDAGSTWTDVALDVADTGSYTWTIPEGDSTECLVRVQEAGGGASDVSDATFTIAPATITLAAPNGGETWYYQGPDQTVSWTSVGLSGTVDIHYSGDGGSTWAEIALDVASTGSYTWTIPYETSPQCLVRVQEAGGGGLSDVSDAPFTITPLTITVTLPAGAVEGDGTLVGQGTVSIPAAWATDLVIDLGSSDTTELTVGATVTILQGDTSATFDLSIEDDGVGDGTQTVTVRATAGGWAPGSAEMDILEPAVTPFAGGCRPGGENRGRPRGSGPAAKGLGLLFGASLCALASMRRRARATMELSASLVAGGPKTR